MLRVGASFRRTKTRSRSVRDGALYRLAGVQRTGRGRLDVAAATTFGGRPEECPSREREAGYEEPDAEYQRHDHEERAHAEGERKDRRAGERTDDAGAFGLGGVGIVFGPRLHPTAPPVVVTTGHEAEQHASEHHHAARVLEAPVPVDRAHDAEEDAEAQEDLGFDPHAS